jgi:hypothetical protein
MNIDTDIDSHTDDEKLKSMYLVIYCYYFADTFAKHNAGKLVPLLQEAKAL